MIQKINPKYDTLDKIRKQLIKDKVYKYTIKTDRWDGDFFANKKCIIVKKTKAHSAKIRFIEPNVVNVLGISTSYIIPQKGVIGYLAYLIIRKGQSQVVLDTIENLKKL